MADVTIANGNLIVRIQGLRQLWTLRRTLVFPLTSVRSVARGRDVRKEFPRFWEKRLGTNVVRLYYGGIFSRRGERTFWDVRRPEDTVVISLADESYKRLLIDVDDPDETVKEITEALTTVA